MEIFVNQLARQMLTKGFTQEQIISYFNTYFNGVAVLDILKSIVEGLVS